MLVCEPAVNNRLFGQNHANSFDIGYSASFIVDHNTADIVSASHVLISMIQQNYEIGTDHSIKVYESHEEIITDLKNKKLDAIGLPVIDYLAIKSENLLDPVVIANIGNQVFERYLLLVNNLGGIKSFNELRNKKVIIGSSHMGSVAKLWLEKLLLENNYAQTEQYFADVKHISKASKVVIPLFLSQIDACVISQSAYKTMVDLNPQLGNQLTALETSPKFANNIFCMRNGLGEDEYNTQIRNSLTDMANNTAGHQLLKLFMINRLEPIKPDDLTNTMDLVRTIK